MEGKAARPTLLGCRLIWDVTKLLIGASSIGSSLFMIALSFGWLTRGTGGRLRTGWGIILNGPYSSDCRVCSDCAYLNSARIWLLPII